MVHLSLSDYPSSLVLEGDFTLKLEKGGEFKATRLVFASHSELDDRNGIRDLVCFLESTTDEITRFAEADPQMRGHLLEAARGHPGKRARLVLEAPPWMLARFNGALSYPWPPVAKDLLENQAWLNVAFDVEAYGPVALVIVTEANEVELELPVGDS